MSDWLMITSSGIENHQWLRVINYYRSLFFFTLIPCFERRWSLSEVIEPYCLWHSDTIHCIRLHLPWKIYQVNFSFSSVFWVFCFSDDFDLSTSFRVSRGDFRECLSGLKVQGTHFVFPNSLVKLLGDDCLDQEQVLFDFMSR